MTALLINGVAVDDTFAEAFPMKATRLVVTAHDIVWARHAAVSATGLATSVIACGCEAGIERELDAGETPDGRPGIAILLFAMSGKELVKQIERRVGQCVMTCPTTAVFAGLPPEAGEAVALGRNLRFFGDGWQFSKKLEGRRYWRLPVMDGEFTCEDVFGTVKGVAGGNFLILARSQAVGLAAAEAAVAAIRAIPGVILPFPGGIVRSGSKVGSRYKSLRASTNDAYCPTLRGVVKTALAEDVAAVYELVIDGVDQPAVEQAMRVGIRAACVPGVVRITAGNYGGTLGPFHLHLHKLLP